MQINSVNYFQQNLYINNLFSTVKVFHCAIDNCLNAVNISKKKECFLIIQKNTTHEKLCSSNHFYERNNRSYLTKDIFLCRQRPCTMITERSSTYVQSNKGITNGVLQMARMSVPLD